MLTLRLVHRSEAGDAHAADVSLDDGSAVERASSRFVFPIDAADREQLRWYLEDYLEFPLDPAPTLAAAAEARLGELGTVLFGSVFAGEAAELWARVRPRLGETRVEVAADPGDGPCPGSCCATPAPTRRWPSGPGRSCGPTTSPPADRTCRPPGRSCGCCW